MYRPSLAEPKANLSVGSEQVKCLCGSAVQFDFGSNRLSAVFFFECPRLKIISPKGRFLVLLGVQKNSLCCVWCSMLKVWDRFSRRLQRAPATKVKDFVQAKGGTKPSEPRPWLGEARRKLWRCS